MSELLGGDYLGAVRGRVADLGLSVVYEPESSAVVDILFLHGLQGHPFNTWASTKTPKSQQSKPQEIGSKDHRPEFNKNETLVNSLKEKFRSVVSRRSKHESEDRRAKPCAVAENHIQEEVVESDPLIDQGAISGGPSPCFWPKDLLPKECPGARVLTWGYDTHVTRHFNGATNKNGVFSHSKDLLWALRRARVAGRPIIFVVHSLGGIVVKEMLSASDVSEDPELRSIVESTAAVVFMGTPHRGSLDMASLGEKARKFASAVRLDTNPKILDILGLKTSDLERCQESFSRIWAKYDFRVKTFQEGLGLTGAHLGILNDKVVPSYSSLLGDAREHAETLQANHMDMCRFSGFQDPNFIKVGGEISRIYTSITKFRIPQSDHVWSLGSSGAPADQRSPDLDHVEKGIHQGGKPTKRAAHGTCGWLFDHSTFMNWHEARDVETHRGLIWIKGNLGSGKSTLIQESYRRVCQMPHQDSCHTAAFFFAAKGDKLLRNPAGLYRSLLYQLLPHRREALRKAVGIYEEKAANIDPDEEAVVSWDEIELQDLFRGLSEDPYSPRTILFIDGLDECEGDQSRDLAFFFRELTYSAHDAGVKLQVCLSSRHFGAASVSNCPTITIEQHNKQDIMSYISQKLAAHDIGNSEAFHGLKTKIIDTSSGNFLWVVLVVDMLLKELDEGKSEKHLGNRLSMVPPVLEDLFKEILKQTNEDRETTLRFFQWVILAGELRLREWHHILPYLRRPAPKSLQECQKSANIAETDEQLEKQIRHISMGLVEVTTHLESDTLEANGSDHYSIAAGAGSFDLGVGETRIVCPIHESIKQFFLHQGGFSAISPKIGQSAIGHGYVSIMDTCLDFIEVPELDDLVKARLDLPDQMDIPEDESSESESYRSRKSSVRSFSSASSVRHARALSYASSGATSFTGRQGVSPPSAPGVFLGVGPRANHSNTELHEGSTEEMMAYRISLLSQSRLHDSSSFLPQASSIDSLSVSLDYAQPGYLQNYPALLSYILSTFHIHAKAAEKQGVDATRIILRLRDGRLWQRWLCLTETIPQGTKLIAWAEAEGLLSWVTHLSCTRVDPYILAAARQGNRDVVSSLIQENAILNCCHDRGESFLTTVNKSDSPQWLLESHQRFLAGASLDDFEMDLALKSPYQANFTPQLARQLITLPVAAEALRRMGSDPEMATTISSAFQKIFAILLFAEIQCIPEIITEFIKLGVNDTNLPFEFRRSKTDSKLNLDLWSCGTRKTFVLDSGLWTLQNRTMFFVCQWEFLAPFFARPAGKIYHFILNNEQIPLPIIERHNLVDKSGYSVSRLEFDLSSCDFGIFQFRPEADGWYIMKTLTSKRAWKSFLSEVYGWKLLEEHSKNKLDIVPLLCTFESPSRLHYFNQACPPGSFYRLIFPSPSGDLPGLWTRYPDGATNMTHAPDWIALQCLKIADSLATIHQNEKLKTLQIPGRVKRKSRFIQYGDILPCRIWWFHLSDTKCETNTLVLSNFCIGSDCAHPSMTCCSPEFKIVHDAEFTYRRKVGPKSDIWGLACTWLEFVTWYLKGEKGVQEFSKSRLKRSHPEIKGDEYFRLIDNEKAATLKPSVIHAMENLRLQENCSPFLRDLLIYIEGKMLVVDMNKRATALEVSEQVHKLYDQYYEAK